MCRVVDNEHEVDGKAIMVIFDDGAQFGWLPSQILSVLIPLMNDDHATLFGQTIGVQKLKAYVPCSVSVVLTQESVDGRSIEGIHADIQNGARRVLADSPGFSVMNSSR